MNYFREHAVLDYFSGGFDGAGEGVLLVHGSVSRALARPSWIACSAWRRTSRSSTRPTRSCRRGSRRLHAAAGDAQLGIRGFHHAASGAQTGGRGADLSENTVSTPV